VTKASEQDEKKLERLMGFLKGASDYFLTIKGDGDFQIHAYIDASWSLHAKSHSGVVNMIGGALVYVSSQKNVSYKVPH
jgi:hypothetical protein